MKSLLKASIIPIILLGALITMYFIGHKIGRMYGAQQYTKKLWLANETQISTNKVFDKINAYREKNKLEPLKETAGLCKYAQYRAKETMESVGFKWNKQTQSYEGIEDMTKAMHQTQLTFDEAQKLCPECDLKTIGENAYISVRPEPCINFSGKKMCVGTEGFGVVENYTDRVVDGWINSPVHNELLLSPIKFGCVGSYGGIVMLEVAEVK